MNIRSNAQLGLAGEWKLRILNADRQVVRETDWFPNLITDGGLDRIGSGSPVGQFCRIGTGNTTPANSDNALVTQVASTSTTVGAVTLANAGSPNYETESVTTYEFALGAVTGNQAEIGVGWASSGATLFSRALIVDGGGTPTTISPQASEILQAAYRLKLYPKTTDTTGTVTIGGVSYDYTSRAYSIGSTLSPTPVTMTLSLVSIVNAYNGTLGASTSSGPSGTSAALTAGSFAAYSNGTHYRDFTVSAGLAVANLAGGISAIAFSVGHTSGTLVRGQIGFAATSGGAAIPKDNTKQFGLTVRVAWARH